LGKSVIPSCKNPLIRFLLAILIVGALAWVLTSVSILIWLHYEFRGHEYVFDVPAGMSLTEEVALRYSKKALIMGGEDSKSMMRPIRWRTNPEGHEESFFSRNTIDPSTGCVRWMAKNSNYSVTVSLHNKKLQCEVFRLK